MTVEHPLYCEYCGKPSFCSYCGEVMLFRYDWQQGKHKTDCPTQIKENNVVTKAIEELAKKLKIRSWYQGEDGFGGEWKISSEHYKAMQEFWDLALRTQEEGKK